MEKEKFVLKDFMKEVGNNFIRFFINVRGYEKDFEIPKELKKIGNKVGVMNLIMALVSLVFGFVLKLSNLLIEQKVIVLGIALYLFYQAQRAINELYRLIETDDEEKLDFLFENSVISQGGKIILKTLGKVEKKEEEFWKVMENEEIYNCIKNYVTMMWKVHLEHKFEICQLFSVLVMLGVAIYTNDDIPQYIFIPMLTVFVIASFITTTYVSNQNRIFNEKDRKARNKRGIIVNDLVRIPNIVQNDTDMRLNQYRRVIKENSADMLRFHKERNTANIILSLFEILFQYGIVISYLWSYYFSTAGEINLEVIAKVTAVVVILQTAFNYVSRMARMFARYSEKWNKLEEEKKDMELIMNVYTANISFDMTKPITHIVFDEFSIQYPEASMNDLPFTLINNDVIIFEVGDIVILNGPSGSGKSTFMKMATERINVKKSSNLPATHRYTYFDESLRFGSLSLYDELFCKADEDYSVDDRDKMKDILSSLHLWQELQTNCIDVWEALKTKKYKEISNGQKQRMILAKILYWLDDSIDVVVLDEATSGLDAHSETEFADAQKIMKYLIEYCNRDKRRIMILATHQELDDVKAYATENGFKIKEFEFVNHEDFNEIVSK